MKEWWWERPIGSDRLQDLAVKKTLLMLCPEDPAAGAEELELQRRSARELASFIILKIQQQDNSS